MNAVNCISYLFFQETLFIQSNYQHTIYRNNRLGHCQRNSAALQFIQLPNQSLNLRPLGHIGPNQKSDVESFFFYFLFFFGEAIWFDILHKIKCNDIQPYLVVAQSNTFWDINCTLSYCLGQESFFFWLHLFD